MELSNSHTEETSSEDSEINTLCLDAESDWKDVESDDEGLASTVSLFGDLVFSSAQSMLQHCKEYDDFDLAAVIRDHGYDFLESVKLVNYLRSEFLKYGAKPDLSDQTFLDNEIYLIPVLEDDGLLISLSDIVDTATGPGDNETSNLQVTSAEDLSTSMRTLELEKQLEIVQSEFMEYKHAVAETLDQRWAAETSETATGQQLHKTSRPDHDSNYFESYAFNDIHETMLKDTVRTSAYRDFIYDNKHLIAGKIVLDVGCGTGILSMFCAKAGAKKVIAVDNSNIITKAREIIIENNLGDIVTCLRGKVEEVILPVKEVDVIVSEWMGYCLLYEAMLDSVLWARDRYLSSTGLMIPSFAVLQMAPVSDSEYVTDSVAYWHDVYGFRMSAMLEKIYDDVLIRTLRPENLAAASSPFAYLPLHEITIDELASIRSKAEYILTEDIEALDGFIIWFDIIFQTSRQETIARVQDPMKLWRLSHPQGIAFTTGPFGQETHWKSGMLLINPGAKPAGPMKKGQRLVTDIVCRKRTSTSRELEIEVHWLVDNGSDMIDIPRRQRWIMQ